ncbi:MAG: hypothetical protein GY839_12595 [candidate division Zixibacteria bacterium]|nr:hypothetical protein [candidate division Zixibacteria bacterium]
MLEFLITLNLGLLAILACLGLSCFFIGSRLWRGYESRNETDNSFPEQLFLISLKSFSVIYLISISVVAVSIPLVLIYSWSAIQTLPDELPMAAAIVLIVISLGGIAALTVAFRKPMRSLKTYLPILPEAEPTLHKMILELSDHFELEPIEDIRITPGSEIEIKEQVQTFEDVFSDCSKYIEIGMSSLELLLASDLKVLMARQFAFYEESDDPPACFIRKLDYRLQTISDNLLDVGFLVMLNPVAWMAMGMRPIISQLTSDYLLTVEFKADEAVAEYSGSQRLTNALARYNVETERFRELIDIANDFSRAGGGMLGGNIYDVMKRAKTESTDDLKVMIEHLFTETNLSRSNVSKRFLKLRLKRLPETAETPIDFNRPAITWLTDWRQTENRMMKLINI